MEHIKRLRQGVTLAEFLIASALVLMIIGFCTELYVRGSVVSDETTKAIGLQQSVRTIVEHLARDMQGAYWICDAGANKREHGIVVIKYASDNSDMRLELNIDNDARRANDYPFSRQTEAVTNSMEAYRAIYSYDEDKGTVSRAEDKGLFRISTERSRLSHATEYDWVPSEVIMDERVLGDHIKQFDIHYFGYERSPDPGAGAGCLKSIWDLEHVGDASDEVKIGMTACIMLHISARYDTGVYQDGGGHRAPHLEMVTKMWSLPRLKDEVYHEYFSSVDWDLQY